jgi:low temperature requirement protein LtrA
MLELHGALSAAKAAVNNGDNKLTPAQQQRLNVAVTVIVIIEVALWIWAIARALQCSNQTPDSRALHLMFAVVSPVLYLVFSYTVTGFCAADVHASSTSLGQGFR